MPGVIFMMKTQDHTNRMKKNGALAHTISLHLCKLSNLKSQVRREYDKHLIFNGNGIVLQFRSYTSGFNQIYRQRQPKMSAGLDLEEDVTFDDSQDNPDLPRSQKLFRKNILIDGMINLTGKGARLGVIKFTDAETDKSIARIQARRADEVSFGD